MKKAFYGFLFLLFAFATIGIISTFFLSSCKDISPDNNKSKSYFSINDELFTITQGGLVNLGSASDESKHPGFMHVVLFTTDGINFSEDNTGELLLKGEGALLGIVVFNDTEGILDSGDYNDNPNNVSIEYLTQKSNYRPTFLPLFNPMKKLFKNGIGSLAHRDRWFLFDQILLSENWRFKTNPFFIKAAVYNPPFLRNPEGKYIGYPYRNSVQGKKLLGFSDHFPVYVLIGKKSVKE